MLALVSYVLLLGVLALGVYRRPIVGFAGVLCLYGLKQWGQSSTQFFAQNTVFTNYSIGALVVFGLALKVARSQCLFCRLPRSYWLVIGLYLYALLTLIWTPDLPTSLEQWRLQFPYIITICALSPLLLTDIDDMGAALGWTLMLGFALCALALFFGHWGSRGLLLFEDRYRHETNPLALASLGGTILIIAALSFGYFKSGPARTLLILAIPIGVAIMLRSGSRGQSIAAIGCAVLGWPLAYRQRSVGSILAWLTAGCLIAATAWLAFDLLDLNAQRWDAARGADDAAGRLASAGRLLADAMRNPATILFGLGNSSAFYYVGFYPHVAPAEVLAEEGVLGASIYLAIVLGGIHSLATLVRRTFETADAKRRAIVGVLGSLFAFEFLLSTKQGSFLGSTYVMVYAVMLSQLSVRWSAATATGLAGGASAPRDDGVRFPQLLR